MEESFVNITKYFVKILQTDEVINAAMFMTENRNFKTFRFPRF